MRHIPHLVDYYIEHFRPMAQRELDHFKKQDSHTNAIIKAANAINSKGKRYSHQYRIRRSAIQEVENRLLDNIETINKCICFFDLHELLNHLIRDIYGIGELFVYDTSLRVGSYLGFLPNKIYMHAGTRAGAKQLGIDHKKDFITKEKLPDELQKLRPHEIEDFLCIFKDKFGRIKDFEKEIIQKRSSWGC